MGSFQNPLFCGRASSRWSEAVPLSPTTVPALDLEIRVNLMTSEQWRIYKSERGVGRAYISGENFQTYSKFSIQMFFFTLNISTHFLPPKVERKAQGPLDMPLLLNAIGRG